MKKADAFLGFIAGIWLGAMFVMLLLVASRIEFIDRKALIKQGLASYNQTTGEFICDICKE